MSWKSFSRALALPAIALFASAPMFAAATTGLPWEHPLQLIANSLTGPVAFFVGIIGFAIAGCVLVFAHEMGEFGRKIVMLSMVVSTLVFATPILSSAFGISASVI